MDQLFTREKFHFMLCKKGIFPYICIDLYTLLLSLKCFTNHLTNPAMTYLGYQVSLERKIMKDTILNPWQRYYLSS